MPRRVSACFHVCGSFQGGAKPGVTRQREISLKFWRRQGSRLRWNLLSLIKILESLQQLSLHQQKRFLQLMRGIRVRDSCQ